MKWDKNQIKLIKAPPESRIIVDAGPGTGKTAVACARVARLIEIEQLNPNDIWMISFTRTAVHEVRNRISSYLSEPENAYGISIATIDSQAWMIHSGFNKEARILGNYEENIEKLLRLIKKDSEVRDYLGSVQHILIDETQDIVGVRAELLLEIINILAYDCGITVFADKAQSIYGFATEDSEDSRGEKEKTLFERLESEYTDKFTKISFDTVYRTNNEILQTIFTSTRQKVLTEYDDPHQKYKDIRKEIKKLSGDIYLPSIEEQQIPESESTFILFRRRAEVLLASSFLNTKPHRIRMSGIPQPVSPWIGLCLGEFTEKKLSKEEFRKKWKIKISNTAYETTSYQSAWDLLYRFAGDSDTVIDMNKLRISLSRGKPPVELCSPEIGINGPLLGTIHALKGREADRVHLMMPDMSGEDIDYDEETRVIFVAATRPKSILKIGKGYWKPARSLENTARVYSIREDGTSIVEFGKESDIEPIGVAGKKYFSNANAVRLSQTQLAGIENSIINIQGKLRKDKDFTYELYSDESEISFGYLSPSSVNKDLFTIAKEIQNKKGGGNRKPPENIYHLRIMGIRTIVIPPDSPYCNELHQPWADSGILLAPNIIGFSKLFFPYQKNHYTH